ncbi:hypothetical protein DUNSADRAFT_12982 [Dunaliella salina]|uniref:Uncharacterized protein n=1 Tax=Dunaliella salina TaxID=3046 RepID=A0ABQ7GAA6_DUNSA|nr:hypothetical protein DUNSADRAFT_12982 [Dunaliella salina]|eukprot:KAF5831536.1 hypothetical protein DUNSADRAFT_12982 [Dunaliella salina]
MASHLSATLMTSSWRKSSCKTRGTSPTPGKPRTRFARFIWRLPAGAKKALSCCCAWALW